MSLVGLEKFLLHLEGVDAVYHALDAYYDDADHVWDSTVPYPFRRVQVVFTRDDGDDVCVNTWDWLNTTSDAIDYTWTDSDFTSLEGKLSTFYTALGGSGPNIWAPGVHLYQYRWYRMPSSGTAADPAPPVRITTPDVDIGGGLNALPHQCAITVTKQLPSKRHWGRVYLGPLNPNVLGTLSHSGSLDGDKASDIADAAETLLTDARDADYRMLVYDRAHMVGQGVTGVRVDNVIDIQRRRRQQVSITRAVRP